MSQYKANFTVIAVPMSLGDYCRKAGWYSDGIDGDTPGYYLTYQPSGKTGWMTGELFDSMYKPIETLYE